MKIESNFFLVKNGLKMRSVGIEIVAQGLTFKYYCYE